MTEEHNDREDVRHAHILDMMLTMISFESGLYLRLLSIIFFAPVIQDIVMLTFANINLIGILFF